VEKWAVFFCPLFHSLPERKERKHSINTQRIFTNFQNKLSQIIDTFRPPKKLLKKFDDYFEPMILKIAANSKESRMLESLREVLLLRLMRGEIHIEDL
jgi:hypothetical protein